MEKPTEFQTEVHKAMLFPTCLYLLPEYTVSCTRPLSGLSHVCREDSNFADVVTLVLDRNDNMGYKCMDTRLLSDLNRQVGIYC